MPVAAKKWVMVFWYNMVSRLDTGDDLLFLNHGFAALGANPKTLDLTPNDEKNRYPIQLYHDLAATVDWTDRDALEVSSGRGGGVDWIMRNLGPRTMVGLDIAKVSTNFCSRRFTDPNLSFRTGDAQAMPFEDQSFDIVLNVESSLNYEDIDAFLREVDRILRPGGRFLIGDYRGRRRMAELREGLGAMGYEILRMDDITANIIAGLTHTATDKRRIIEKYAPRFLRGLAQRFVGIDDDVDREHERFQSGMKSYVAATLAKPRGG